MTLVHVHVRADSMSRVRLSDLLDRPRLVALVAQEQPVCGVFLASGELVVAWDWWVHVFSDPHGHESVDWCAGEYVVGIQRAPEPGVAICRLRSGTAVELRVERSVVKTSPLDQAPAAEEDIGPALPPIDGGAWVVPIAATDDSRTVLILSDSELIVGDLRRGALR